MSDNLKEAGFAVIDKETVDKLLAVKKDEGAEVELHRAQAGVLGGFTKTEIMGVPAGAAGIGLLIGGAWDAIRGLVGSKLPANIPQWVIPFVGAMAVQSKFVKPRIGDAAANSAGLILSVDAIQALFNVRGVISGLVSGVKFRQTGAAGATGNNSQSVDEYLKAHGLV